MSEVQILPAWLDAGAAALSGAVPPAPTLAGALPGLDRAQSLSPPQRLQRLQESGLVECGSAGEPIYLAWRQFLRGRGPSVLVIDATDFDSHARGSAAVLQSAIWLLAEGGYPRPELAPDTGKRIGIIGSGPSSLAAASIDAWLRGAALDAATGRCLRCDVCIGCGLCMAACSEMGVEALRMADTTAGRLAYFDFTRPAELCIGCGACTQVCPTGAIHIEDRNGVRRTIITGTVVREQPLLACSQCGAPTQTPAHRDFVRRRLPDHMAALLDRELCPSCARQRADRPAAVPTGLRRQ